MHRQVRFTDQGRRYMYSDRILDDAGKFLAWNVKVNCDKFYDRQTQSYRMHIMYHYD